MNLSKQSAYFRVPGLSGNRGSNEIKERVAQIPGVLSVSVNRSTNKVAVDYDSTGTSCEKIKEKIEEAGFEAQLLANQNHIM